jgi:hypothetical protein
MQIVYVVTTGEYSDKIIRGVCSDLQKAQSLTDSFRNGNTPKAFDLDGDVPDHPAGHKLWNVEINLKTGDILNTIHLDPTEEYQIEIIYPMRNTYSNMHVWAEDVAHANKIATDWRREFLVEERHGHHNL